MEPSKKIGPGCKEHMDRVTWKRETDMSKSKRTKYPEVQCRRCGATYGGHPGSKKPPKQCVVGSYLNERCDGLLYQTELGRRQWDKKIADRLGVFNAALTPAPDRAEEK